MNDTSIELLESLTQADGIPGYEGEVREVFREAVSDIGPTDISQYDAEANIHQHLEWISL